MVDSKDILSVHKVVADDTGKVSGCYLRDINDETSDGEYFDIGDDVFKTQPIVGVFREKDGRIKFISEALSSDKSALLKTEVIDKLIVGEKYKRFADCCRRIIPSYFYEVPASTSGKYHPASNLGDGGLLRHTIFACKNLNYLTTPESCKQRYNLTQDDIDGMVVACMMHDAFKQGFGKSGHCVNEHPNYAADAVRGMRGFLPDKDIEFIAGCVETHMGEWNTMKDKDGNSIVVTRKPETDCEHLVHMADYMASRPDVSLSLNDTYYVKERATSKIVYSDDKLQPDKQADNLKNIVSSKREVPNIDYGDDYIQKGLGE